MFDIEIQPALVERNHFPPANVLSLLSVPTPNVTSANDIVCPSKRVTIDRRFFSWRGVNFKLIFFSFFLTSSHSSSLTFLLFCFIHLPFLVVSLKVVVRHCYFSPFSCSSRVSVLVKLDRFAHQYGKSHTV